MDAADCAVGTRPRDELTEDVIDPDGEGLGEAFSAAANETAHFGIRFGAEHPEASVQKEGCLRFPATLPRLSGVVMVSNT